MKNIYFLILIHFFTGCASVYKLQNTDRNITATTTKYTTSTKSNGTAIINMWTAPLPNAKKRNLGFRNLSKVTETKIFAPKNKSEGGYNHHPLLTYFDNTFWAMWSNNTIEEDGAGQQVYYSTSKDAKVWSKPTLLFPAPVDMVQSSNKKWLAPNDWLIYNNILYARAGGYSSNIQERSVFFREVSNTGLGDIVTLSNKWPENPTTGFNPRLATPTEETNIKAAMDTMKKPPIPNGIDSDKLTEPLYYTAIDGKKICLLRDDNYSHRMYVTFSNDGVTWPTPYPTNIPDSPSKTIVLQLSDKRFALIGNNIAPEFDKPVPRYFERDILTIALSNDGYTFNNAFSVRAGKHKHRIENVGGRGEGGAQYPAAVEVNGNLYVLYSLGKEEIWISTIPLNSLR